MNTIDIDAVESYLLGLQQRICAALGELDGVAHFNEDRWTRAEGGGGITRVLCGGRVFEKAGVAFSRVVGSKLPPSASAHRTELAGRGFTALGVSLVVHPVNPYAPISHMNVRLFVAERAGEPPVWWIGGGYDLTPCYGFDEDCRHWHRSAHAACAPFGPTVHAEFRDWCDRYFHLKHRDEQRGIGGLFFDDLDAWGFERCFAFLRAVGDSYLGAYRPIVERRMFLPWTERERRFQLYRRGRYVEFNLVHDRGTLFGLQSGGRTESILMSLPPLVRWDYGWQAEPGSPEAELTERYLKPRDWLAEP